MINKSNVKLYMWILLFFKIEIFISMCLIYYIYSDLIFVNLI